MAMVAVVPAALVVSIPPLLLVLLMLMLMLMLVLVLVVVISLLVSPCSSRHSAKARQAMVCSLVLSPLPP